MSDEEGALFRPWRSLWSVSKEVVSVVQGAVTVVDAPGGVGIEGAKMSSFETWGMTGSWLSFHTWLLHGDPLWNGERPVDGVQLRVPIDTTVVPDVCARKRTRVSGDVPLTFFLEKLELGRPLSPHGGRSQAALSGRNAAIRLYLGGVEAIVRREVIAVFHSAVAVLEREAVGIGGRAEGCETKEGDHHE